MTEHVCPVWMGYLLASPLRKLFQNPMSILRPYVKSGMTVLDAGCAMGYFSLPMAEIVGPSGRVVCVDLQQKMLGSLEKRARKAKVIDRVETRLCRAAGLGIEDLNGKVDFALAFAMVHEVKDPGALLGEFWRALRPGGLLLVSEPRNHVSSADFEKNLGFGQEAGFAVQDEPKISGSRSVLLWKPPAE